MYIFPYIPHEMFHEFPLIVLEFEPIMSQSLMSVNGQESVHIN